MSIWLILGVVSVLLWFSRGFLRKHIIAGKKYEGTIDLRRKLAIVTGSNTGIGYETAKYLAQHGARVILACRTKEKALEAVASINQHLKDVQTSSQFFPGGSVEFVQLDLGSLSSVRRFASEMLTAHRETGLHILVNNAGLVFTPWSQTPDGFETQFGTNHLGHFLLTLLLLPLLRKAAEKPTDEARIVVVSSKVHTMIPLSGIDFLETWNDEKKYSRVKQYYISKLANVLFAAELQRRLDVESAEGKSFKGIITVNSLHPGSAATDVLKDFPEWFKAIANPGMRLFLKTAEEAAQTQIYCAVAPELKGTGGKYFRNCQIIDSSPLSNCKETAKKLWNLSEKLVGLEQTSSNTNSFLLPS